MSLRLALLSLLAAGVAAAAPPPPGASRAELARWLGELCGSGADIAAPRHWHYAFAAADGRALERRDGARAHGVLYLGIAAS